MDEVHGGITEQTEVNKNFPQKCGEIFVILKNFKINDNKAPDYVIYKYILKEGAEEFRSVRVRKTEEGRYGVLGYGGGAPIAYGLEKSDITLEDILNEN